MIGDVSWDNNGQAVVEVACPGCDANLSLPEELFGKTIRCPGCREKITMPTFKIKVETPSHAPKPPVENPPEQKNLETPVIEPKVEERPKAPRPPIQLPSDKKESNIQEKEPLDKKISPLAKSTLAPIKMDTPVEALAPTTSKAPISKEKVDTAITPKPFQAKANTPSTLINNRKKADAIKETTASGLEKESGLKTKKVRPTTETVGIKRQSALPPSAENAKVRKVQKTPVGTKPVEEKEKCATEKGFDKDMSKTWIQSDFEEDLLDYTLPLVELGKDKFVIKSLLDSFKVNCHHDDCYTKTRVSSDFLCDYHAGLIQQLITQSGKEYDFIIDEIFEIQ